MTTAFPPLRQLAADLRGGTVSARSLLDGVMANHDAADLGAFAHWAGPGARALADHVDALLASGHDTGALMGVPVSVKDLYGVPGMPTHAGTDRELGAEWRRPGPVVTALLRQLALITGKTHTVEFAFGGLGLNAHWPTPRNPWGGGGRVPGGSSSGAGVSLLEGVALLALGTDTAGSVRVPASVTGNVGLKMTHGRWSQDGIVPLSPSFDTPGLLARTADDIAFAFGTLDTRGRAPGPANAGGLRIGRLGGVAAEAVDDDIATAVDVALAKLAGRGARVIPASLRHDAAALALFRQGGLAASELAAFLRDVMPDCIARLDPTVKARVDAADNLSAIDYLRRRAAFARMAAETAADFDGLDVIACATVAISPPRVADLTSPVAYAAANMAVLRNSALANLLGLCAMTLPIGLDRNHMPIGLMLMAPPGHETRLIAAAMAAERILGTGADQLGRPDLTTTTVED